MRQYPIWNVVNGQGRKGSADFGSRNGFSQTIYVGSSSTHSEELATIEVLNHGDGFSLIVNGTFVAVCEFDPETKQFTHKRNYLKNLVAPVEGYSSSIDAFEDPMVLLEREIS